MDLLVQAFGPVFAAGFALQQLLEILVSPLLERSNAANKKLIMGIISTVAGLVLAFAGSLRALHPMGYSGADWLDAIVTGVIISAGTEGVNSILKFLGYAKENKKAEVEARTGSSPA